MPEGCILYLNYCYREHFKTLLPSDTQFQPLFEQSLINLEQNLIIVFWQDFYICAVEWRLFLKCHGRLFTKQKRAAIANASTNFFGLSIHFQVLLVAFTEQKKEENKPSKTSQGQNLIHVTTCLPQKVMSKYLLSKTANSLLQEILLSFFFAKADEIVSNKYTHRQFEL